MISKNRSRLFLVGLLLIALSCLALVVFYFWVPGVLFALAGAYLVVWATAGRGQWCRTCKRFNVS
jgi:hypothetical protein